VVSDKVVTTTTSDVQGAADGSVATVHRGETVAWKVTLRNSGTTGCGLVVVSDTLPSHFTFVSSSGDLTSGVQPAIDGQRIVWSKGSRYALAAGSTLTETIVATVSDDAPFGTYTNLIDVEQSTCSSFTQGLRGPVDVVPSAAVLPIRELRPGTLPRTGQETGVTSLAAALFLLTAGGVFLSSTHPAGRRY
ncbi:MAG: hypothetical protein ACRDJM_03265, partial [Actinomycetota bacterium]